MSKFQFSFCLCSRECERILCTRKMLIWEPILSRYTIIILQRESCVSFGKSKPLKSSICFEIGKSFKNLTVQTSPKFSIFALRRDPYNHFDIYISAPLYPFPFICRDSNPDLIREILLCSISLPFCGRM